MADDRILDEAPWLTIDFGRKGNGVEYVNEGWNGPEAQFSWTLDQTSFLTIDRVPERGALLARLDVWPFVAPPVLSRQRLVVSVNGVRLAQLEVRGKQIFEIRIPESAFRQQGLLRFQFDHPDAARPIDLTQTADGRMLALAFVGLSLHATTDVTPDQEMSIASRSAPESDDRAPPPAQSTHQAADVQAAVEPFASDMTDPRPFSASSSAVATTAPAVLQQEPVQNIGEGLIAKFTSLFRSRSR